MDTVACAGGDPGTPEPWEVGTGVKGYVWHAAAPRAALLLQHGYAEYAQRFVDLYSNIIPRLLELGVSVYAFDLRGHGHSPGARGVVDIDTSVTDHIAARGKLAALPLPLFLFGHSLGGLVTAASVLRNPAGVAGVVLSSPALLVRGSAMQRMVLKLLARIKPAKPAIPQGAPGDNTRRQDIVARHADDPMLYRGPLPMVLASSAMEVSARNRRQYSDWQVPVLVLHGTSDTATDPSGSTQFVAAISASDKTLRLFDDGRHELLNDLVADEALAVILNWIDQRIPGREKPLKSKIAEHQA